MAQKYINYSYFLFLYLYNIYILVEETKHSSKHLYKPIASFPPPKERYNLTRGTHCKKLLGSDPGPTC